MPVPHWGVSTHSDPPEMTPLRLSKQKEMVWRRKCHALDAGMPVGHAFVWYTAVGRVPAVWVPIHPALLQPTFLRAVLEGLLWCPTHRLELTLPCGFISSISSFTPCYWLLCEEGPSSQKLWFSGFSRCVWENRSHFLNSVFGLIFIIFRC